MIGFGLQFALGCAALFVLVAASHVIWNAPHYKLRRLVQAFCDNPTRDNFFDAQLYMVVMHMDIRSVGVSLAERYTVTALCLGFMRMPSDPWTSKAGAACKDTPAQERLRTASVYPNRELYWQEIRISEQTVPRNGCDDRMHICRACGNADTIRVVGAAAELVRDFHEGQPFKLYSCYCCGALWHWRTPTLKP